MAKQIKVYLVNGNSIGTRCGYGQGETHEAAVQDALRQARERDPNATYDANTNTVSFWQRVCL